VMDGARLVDGFFVCRWRLMELRLGVKLLMEEARCQWGERIY
jgi:hypothetical protein